MGDIAQMPRLSLLDTGKFYLLVLALPESQLFLEISARLFPLVFPVIPRHYHFLTQILYIHPWRYTAYSTGQRRQR